jgi:hypothetical protein
MIAIGEEELVCDFAEIYHILDYKSLPAHLAAILAKGLGEDSRIKKKMRGDRISRQELIMAMIFDLFHEYIWAISGGKGEEPKKVVNLLNGDGSGDRTSVRGYDTPEEFEAARRKLIGG